MRVAVTAADQFFNTILATRVDPAALYPLQAVLVNWQQGLTETAYSDVTTLPDDTGSHGTDCPHYCACAVQRLLHRCRTSRGSDALECPCFGATSSGRRRVLVVKLRLCCIGIHSVGIYPGLRPNHSVKSSLPSFIVRVSPGILCLVMLVTQSRPLTSDRFIAPCLSVEAD